MLLWCARVKQQEKMANYCKTIFGDALLTDPLDKYPVSPTTQTLIHTLHHTDNALLTWSAVPLRSRPQSSHAC